ncbi:rho GTPase-activating protein 4-like isoform X2 [Antedon mediterranea]|uniref:rho GTPase-activating protein 4-like isoform X2 n=1 Tax=Antedon mediterranea TaxID=105859 RepID=UPI003AF6085D
MVDGSNVGSCGKHNSEFCNRSRYRVKPLLTPDRLQLGMTSRSSKMSNTTFLTASGLIIICVGLYFIWTKFTKKEGKKERPRSNERRISFDYVVTINEPVPTFIKNCIEIIEENGREHRNIYRSPGNKKKVDRILDNIQDAPTLLGLEDDIDTICSCLKAYIAALSKPLIPSEQQNEFLRVFTELRV